MHSMIVAIYASSPEYNHCWVLSDPTATTVNNSKSSFQCWQKNEQYGNLILLTLDEIQLDMIAAHLKGNIIHWWFVAKPSSGSFEVCLY